MDRRASSAEHATAAPRPPPAPAGRKPKAKAPPPPVEIKLGDISSVDGSIDSSAFIMEQKENIDKDIELSVVLPGDIIKSTTVHGSKPMMDLLIFLCVQYQLNPSSYTIDLLSAEKNPIKFKPNTPIGMLEVEKVILKPKTMDKKKPTPIIPEKTVRVVINFKKTQKTIVRVSPHASLQELVPVICSKCEFDPLHTLLLKDCLSQEPLDLTKSLNDLGLRELYALDVSRESCQISQKLDMLKEKENKGFFSFFQRSKKRWEQTASAPATPVSKPRPSFTRSNTISKQYISNTLPSDAPKKRQAPLPPMSSLQSTPQDLSQSQKRPSSCVVKSTSVDETSKAACGAGMVRTGSLPLGSTSLGSSSLRRTKRKAPSPPSQVPMHPSAESNRMMVEAPPTDSVSEVSSPGGLSSPEGSISPGLPSLDQCPVPVQMDGTSEQTETSEAAVASQMSGISSDYSLEEIDEKEELSELPKYEARNISLKSQNIPFVSTGTINTMKNDPDSALGNDNGKSSQNSKEENQEARNIDGQEPHIVYNTSHDVTAVDSVRHLKLLGSNQEYGQNEAIDCPLKVEDNKKNLERRTEMNVAHVAKSSSTGVEVNRLSNCQECKPDAAVNYKEDHLAKSSLPDQNLNQLTAEKTKMQDAAIQTTPSCNLFGGSHQAHQLSDFSVDESVPTSNNSKSVTQPSSLCQQNSVDTAGEFWNQSTLTLQEDQPVVQDTYCVPDDDIKNYLFHRPKPKPSNEITRCYTPKIGMTTYKIVPPKSLEIVKDWPSATVKYRDGQEMHPLEKKPTPESVRETAIQTEALDASEGPKKTQPGLKPKPNLGTEHLVQRAMSMADGAVANPVKPLPRVMKETVVPPFAPSLEDINSILESQLKSRLSNPQGKPSSFFLQMQKRVAGQYVTSAAAKSVHAAPSPAPKELTNREVERSPLPSPEPETPQLSETATHPPPALLKKSSSDIISEKPVEPSAPPVAPKPMFFPASQVAAQNLKTLKTFGAPRPYSSSASSPFTLAVVKRSQSFSKTPTFPSESSSEGPTTPSPTEIEDEKTSSVSQSVAVPQLGVINKENNSVHSEKNSQLPSPTDCPSLTLKRQSSITFQSSDPEQIRQSLLTAIRSGEAAAKLKRVTVPSYTISVNGRPSVSHATPPDAQDDD